MIEKFVNDLWLPSINPDDFHLDENDNVVGFTLGPYYTHDDHQFVDGMRILLERMGISDKKAQDAKIFELGVDTSDQEDEDLEDENWVNVDRVLTDYFNHIGKNVDIEADPFGQGGDTNGFYLDIRYDYKNQMIDAGHIDKDAAQILDL
jgi:hypothetical protein